MGQWQLCCCFVGGISSGKHSDLLIWCILLFLPAHALLGKEKKVFPKVTKFWEEQTPREALYLPGALGELCQFNWSSHQRSQQSREPIADCLVKLKQKRSKSQIITLIPTHCWSYLYFFNHCHNLIDISGLLREMSVQILFHIILCCFFIAAEPGLYF